jgi:hypothetical protein
MQSCGPCNYIIVSFLEWKARRPEEVARLVMKDNPSFTASHAFCVIYC